MRIDSARITGSIRGSQAFAQLSGSFTGSLDGTASYATSGSYALTASYALNAGSGGITFPYTGAADISGSFSVDGPSVLDGVTVGGHIVPEAAATYNLGSPSASFQHLYLATSSIHFVEEDGTIVSTLNADADGISGSFQGDGSGLTGVISSSYAVSASAVRADGISGLPEILDGYGYTNNTATASMYVSASVDGTENRITFHQGDGTLVNVEITAETASYVITESIVNFDTAVSAAAAAAGIGDQQPDVDAVTGSLLDTASIEDATITFTKGDDSTFSIEVNNVTSSLTASFITASNVVGTVDSASFALTASYVAGMTVETASFVTGSDVHGPHGANSILSASHAGDADNAISASHALRADAADSVEFVDVANKPVLYSGSTQLVDALEGQNLNLNVLSASIFHEIYTTQSINKGSGSFAFGDSADDTHVFTGSVDISGSLLLNGEELSIESASYATTASHALEAAQVTASGIVGTVLSASHAIEAAEAHTASFVTSSNVHGPEGINSVLTASFALTASHLLDMSIESASFATTASYAHTASIVTNPGVRVHNFSSVTSTTFTHNIGRQEVFVQCYDTSDSTPAMIIPAEINLDSDNALTVEFAETTTGYLVVLG